MKKGWFGGSGTNLYQNPIRRGGENKNRTKPWGHCDSNPAVSRMNNEKSYTKGEKEGTEHRRAVLEVKEGTTS